MKRFKETRINRVTGRGDVYKVSMIDEFEDNIQVLTVYTPTEKERLDLIAHKFYGDSSKWFIIARANQEIKGTLYSTPGKTLVIPRID